MSENEYAQIAYSQTFAKVPRNLHEVAGKCDRDNLKS